MPTLSRGGRQRNVKVDCADWFTEALYARPEAFLEPEVRAAQSAWGFVDDADEERIVADHADLLESGEWDRRWGGGSATTSRTRCD